MGTTTIISSSVSDFTFAESTALLALLDGCVIADEQQQAALDRVREKVFNRLESKRIEREHKEFVERPISNPPLAGKEVDQAEGDAIPLPISQRNMPKVPDGMYAIDRKDKIHFYRVNSPTLGKWRLGWTFVAEQASDEFYSVKDVGRKRAILSELAVDALAAAKLYGRTIGVCGVCSRTLTDPESRAAGIGPVCASKLMVG